MLPYGRQTIDDDDIAAVTETLKSDFLTTGPKVAEFEQALCKVTGARYAVVCGNGTQALHLALLATNIGEGDAVIVPSITFLATANAGRYCGAEVVFSDVNPQTGLMEAEHFEEALSRAGSASVKAVLPVHLKGQCIDSKAIQALADRDGIKVITDACHALGSTVRGYQAGSCKFEEMATFSFHPVKTIAMGEGGAVTTNKKETAERLHRLRSHGIIKTADMAPWEYHMTELGYNYRASDINCALGISQMKKLDLFITKRRKLAALYSELLAPLAPVIASPEHLAYCNPAWHLYSVRIDFNRLGMDRAALMTALMEKGVGTQVHYIPVHTQPYYVERYGSLTLPGAQHYYEQTLSLPLFPAMEEQDVRFVVDTIATITGLGR